jgi:predicted ATPase
MFEPNYPLKAGPRGSFIAQKTTRSNVESYQGGASEFGHFEAVLAMENWRISKNFRYWSKKESFFNVATEIEKLDAEEAALSSSRQLAVITRIHVVQAKSQFIIATHSPILTATRRKLVRAEVLSRLGLPVDLAAVKT